MSNSSEISAELAKSRVAKVLLFSHRVWGHILAGKVDSDENCTHSPQIYYRDRTTEGEKGREILQSRSSIKRESPWTNNFLKFY